MKYEGLHWIDTTIVVASVLLAIGVGIYFARKQNSTDAYFAASGNIPAWAVGMSMFATIISSVTFLAYPGSAYAGNWILLVQGLMVPIVLLGVIGFIVPLYRKVIRLSTYEYFERRFGAFARFYSSIAFVLEHFSKMGTILYLLAMAMVAFTGGMDIVWIIVGVGIAVIILTYFGGMEAIIWMDVVQGFLLIIGGVLAVGVIFCLTDGGPAAIMDIATKYHKIDFGPYAWDFTQLTFVVMVFNGIFYALQKYGTDQSIVQRYLTARSDKEAKKASYLGILLSVPTWALFMFVGTCLFAYYQINAGELPAGIKSDEVFPHFIATEMPVGIVGLIIAALIAGAISSLDADVNCISAVVVEDYYARFRPKATDRQRLIVGRISVIVVGIGAILIALNDVQSRQQLHGVAVIGVDIRFVRECRTGKHGERASERQHQCENLFEILMTCILTGVYTPIFTASITDYGTFVNGNRALRTAHPAVLPSLFYHCKRHAHRYSLSL